MGNNTIDSKLIPQLEKEFKKSKNKEKEIAIMVKKFMDKNNEVLSHPTPAFRLVFNNSQREELLRIVDIDKRYIRTLKELIDSDSSVRKPLMYGKISTEFNILSIAIIKYAVLTNNKSLLQNTLMNLTFSFYSIIHPRFFQYLPNVDIMEFTLNRISNKFLFKQYGVLVKTLKHTAEQTHEYAVKSLLDDGDQGALDYLTALNSRLNNQILTFAKEYYQDYEKKNIIFKQSDNYDDENFILTSNLSMEITHNVDNIVNIFFTTRSDKNIIALAARLCQADPNVLIDALDNIKTSKSRDVQELIRNILITYLSDHNNTIDSLGSKKFVGYCLQIYSKSNTKMESILNVKKILDKLLDVNSKRYHETAREATKVNYRKAIYYYFILMMQKSIK